MKIILIGANGQLGTDLRRALEGRGHQVAPLRRADLDITDAVQVETALAEAQPDAVINTAAFHKVEECERNPALAFEVNAIAPMDLARACSRAGALFVHFSTDYVFDGAKRDPYAETDLPAPLNVYGASKVAGEHLIAANTDRFAIIRTCGLYGTAGSSGKGGNFVETMLRKARTGETVRVVNDQVLTPTFTEDLAGAVVSIVENRICGLYHASCEGACSWYEFARKIFEIEGLEVDLRPVATSEFPSPVKRPPYSVLSKQRLRSLGIEMPFWEYSLERYLKARHGVQAAEVPVRR
jgi:dTDP-4-dehydrorhamnose reductase